MLEVTVLLKVKRKLANKNDQISSPHNVNITQSLFQSAVQTNDKYCIVFDLQATGRQNIRVDMSAYVFNTVQQRLQGPTSLLQFSLCVSLCQDTCTLDNHDDLCLVVLYSCKIIK